MLSVAADALIAGLSSASSHQTGTSFDQRVQHSGLNETHAIFLSPPFLRVLRLVGEAQMQRLLRCMVFLSESDYLLCTNSPNCLTPKRLNVRDCLLHVGEGTCGSATCCWSYNHHKRFRHGQETPPSDTRQLYIQICGRALTRSRLRNFTVDAKALEAAEMIVGARASDFHQDICHGSSRNFQVLDEEPLLQGAKAWGTALKFCKSKRDVSRFRAELRRSCRRSLKLPGVAQPTPPHADQTSGGRPSKIFVPRHLIFYHRSFSSSGGLPQRCLLTALTKLCLTRQIAMPRRPATKTSLPECKCEEPRYRDKLPASTEFGTLGTGTRRHHDVPHQEYLSDTCKLNRRNWTATNPTSVCELSGSQRCSERAVKAAARVLTRFVLTDNDFYTKSCSTHGQLQSVDKICLLTTLACSRRRRILDSMSAHSVPSAGGLRSGISTQGLSVSASSPESGGIETKIPSACQIKRKMKFRSPLARYVQ